MKQTQMANLREEKQNPKIEGASCLQSLKQRQNREAKKEKRIIVSLKRFTCRFEIALFEPLT